MHLESCKGILPGPFWRPVLRGPPLVSLGLWLPHCSPPSSHGPLSVASRITFLLSTSVLVSKFSLVMRTPSHTG